MRLGRYAHILPLGLTSILAACDSQAAPDLLGESLLTLSGSVTIEKTPGGGELRPALAFFDSETGKVHIVDVVVEGKFPSDFTLRVTEPPPLAAFFTGPDGIRSALGYITAVTEDGPATFRYATQQSSSGMCWDTDEVPSGRVCDHEQWWCSGQGEDRDCYREWFRCTSIVADLHGDECDMLDATGDPALKDTWARFAGLSEDLVVVYLDEPLEADAKDAMRLGVPGLEAGYTVLKPEPKHDADSEAGFACDEKIRRRAHALQEEKYGASLSYEDLLAQAQCGEESVVDDDTWLPCDPRTDMVRERMLEFEPKAAAEIGCRATGAWRVVDEEEREHVEIRIGTSVEPSLYWPDRPGHTQPFTPSEPSGGLPSDYLPFDPCNEPELEMLAWTEESPLGATPKALFGDLEAGCTSTLTWESFDRMITAAGSTEVTVELRIDHDSARYLRFPSLLAGRCEDRLEVDAELTVRTADGAIDQTTTVTLKPGGELRAWVPLDKHGGTLDAQREDGETFGVRYSLSGAGKDCAGEILLGRQPSAPGLPPDRVVFNLLAGVGSWSNNGCGAGEQVLDASAPLESAGASPQDLVARMFGQITLEGAWKDDDTAAQLHLSARLQPDASVCAPNGNNADVPVTVTYGTSDGTIVDHTVEGHVSLSFDAPDELEAALVFDDLMECKDRSASLRYTPADCNALHGVTVEMHLGHDGKKLTVYDDALFVYAFERGGVLDRFGEYEVESADARRALEVEP